LSITETFLLYAVGALLWALIGAGICWAFMSINRPDDDEDDAEQMAYLKKADEQVATRKRLAAYKPYPNIESKS
jgi:hypothetical protein